MDRENNSLEYSRKIFLTICADFSEKLVYGSEGPSERDNIFSKRGQIGCLKSRIVRLFEVISKM